MNFFFTQMNGVLNAYPLGDMSETFFYPSEWGVKCLLTVRTQKYNSMNQEGMYHSRKKGKE